MLPATVTVSSVLGQAGNVVSEFDTLIVIVVGLALGFTVVRFLISKLRKAGR